MTMYLHIIWPLEGPAPAWDEAERIYSRLDDIRDEKSMGPWFVDCLMGDHANLVAKMGIRPYEFANSYDSFEENGFPEDEDEWFSPDEIIAATWKLQSLIGNEDPDALALVEWFMRHNRAMRGPRPPVGQPIPRVLEGEDPAEVARFRLDALAILLDGLQGVIHTANNCKREGIERIAFCLVM